MENDSTGVCAGRMRKQYIELADARPGQSLAEALTIVERNALRLRLPAGHTLTESNLRQLAALHAEYVAISVPDLRSDAEIADEVAAAAARVMTVFDGCDLSNPSLAALFDRVLDYRSR